ncbi:SIS domain-containing protein [Candidatus Woesearchaeota archaeon]|nr:SIS domain-containing protein [Candidatus Woesearchaeota archaeon]
MVEINEKVNVIINEISHVFSHSDFSNISEFIDKILKSKKIVCIGAGRVGYATRGFAMRLKHLGLDSYMLGDSNVPNISENDLLLVSSGSGETQTIFDVVEIAKKNRAVVCLITGNEESRMAKLADVVLLLKAPSKIKDVEGLISVQPMTSLNEQCLGLFFDAVVLLLMEKLNESHETMWERHSNLE